VVAADRPTAGLDAGLDLEAAGTHRRLVVVGGQAAGLDRGLHAQERISCCREFASAAPVTRPPPRWTGWGSAVRKAHRTSSNRSIPSAAKSPSRKNWERSQRFAGVATSSRRRLSNRSLLGTRKERRARPPEEAQRPVPLLAGLRRDRRLWSWWRWSCLLRGWWSGPE
jgi:hypothetical protein